jgi:hypothetical protein
MSGTDRRLRPELPDGMLGPRLYAMICGQRYCGF